MKIRNLVCIGILCGVIILSGCGDKATNTDIDKKSSTAVEVINVKSGEIAVESRINGRVVSENEVSIYSPINAEVKSVNVKL